MTSTINQIIRRFSVGDALTPLNADESSVQRKTLLTAVTAAALSAAFAGAAAVGADQSDYVAALSAELAKVNVNVKAFNGQALDDVLAIIEKLGELGAAAEADSDADLSAAPRTPSFSILFSNREKEILRRLGARDASTFPRPASSINRQTPFGDFYRKSPEKTAELCEKITDLAKLRVNHNVQFLQSFVAVAENVRVVDSALAEKMYDRCAEFLEQASAENQPKEDAEKTIHLDQNPNYQALLATLYELRVNELLRNIVPKATLPDGVVYSEETRKELDKFIDKAAASASGALSMQAFASLISASAPTQSLHALRVYRAAYEKQSPEAASRADEFDALCKAREITSRVYEGKTLCEDGIAELANVGDDASATEIQIRVNEFTNIMTIAALAREMNQIPAARAETLELEIQRAIFRLQGALMNKADASENVRTVAALNWLDKAFSFGEYDMLEETYAREKSKLDKGLGERSLFFNVLETRCFELRIRRLFDQPAASADLPRELDAALQEALEKIDDNRTLKYSLFNLPLNLPAEANDEILLFALRIVELEKARGGKDYIPAPIKTSGEYAIRVRRAKLAGQEKAEIDELVNRFIHKARKDRSVESAKRMFRDFAELLRSANLTDLAADFEKRTLDGQTKQSAASNQQEKEYQELQEKLFETLRKSDGSAEKIDDAARPIVDEILEKSTANLFVAQQLASFAESAAPFAPNAALRLIDRAIFLQKNEVGSEEFARNDVVLRPKRYYIRLVSLQALSNPGEEAKRIVDEIEADINQTQNLAAHSLNCFVRIGYLCPREELRLQTLLTEHGAPINAREKEAKTQCLRFLAAVREKDTPAIVALAAEINAGPDNGRLGWQMLENYLLQYVPQNLFTTAAKEFDDAIASLEKYDAGDVELKPALNFLRKSQKTFVETSEKP